MKKGHYTCTESGYLGKMARLSGDLQAIYSNIFEAFLQHKSSSLKVSYEYNQRAETLMQEVTDYLLANGQREDARLEKTAVLEILKFMDQIRNSANKISISVSNKINDSVLFSDKAVAELKDLFDVVIDSLNNVTDLVVTGNEVIAKHLINRSRLYSEVIKEYAIEHEERLIKGICLPKSSIIYLSMLDTLKDVLWNIKRIGEAFQ